MTTNVPAKKSLGQNWLVNEGVLDRIIGAAALTPDDTVVEVGPGQGALTGRLADTGAHIFAIEKDRRLVAPLQQQFAGTPNVHIIEGDILETGLPKEVHSPYKIIANIPYYITSHLIRLMLEVWTPPSVAVLMVQHEVARRMMAIAPDMNLLALSVQLYARPTLVMRVSRGSFRPMPTVDSAVVTLKSRESVDRDEAGRVLAIARKAFGQKRKQLKATLPQEALERADIRPTARPEELSLDQWRRIALALH